MMIKSSEDTLGEYLALLVNVWVVDLCPERHLHGTHTFLQSKYVTFSETGRVSMSFIVLTFGGLKGYSAGKTMSIRKAPWKRKQFSHNSCPINGNTRKQVRFLGW